MTETHPWNLLETDIPQPGTLPDDRTIEHLEKARGKAPEVPIEDDTDEADELNVYDEADDEFEDDDA